MGKNTSYILMQDVKCSKSNKKHNFDSMKANLYQKMSSLE